MAQTAVRRKQPPEKEAPLSAEKISTPACSTIEALAAFLGISPARTAKSLMYARSGSDSLVFAVLRGDTQVSEAKLHNALGELDAATPEQIRAAGAVPGYASPIGLQQVEVLVDDLIPACANLVAGANETGFHLLNTNYGRDYVASHVADITLTQEGDPCSNCGSALRAGRAHLVRDSAGVRTEEALLCLAAQNHDDRGLTLPAGLSPFDVYVVQIPSKTGATAPVAAAVHLSLERAGIAVMLDDRDERAGVKFNDADLLGFPLRITVGEKHLQDQMVEWKTRSSPSTELVSMDAIVEQVQSFLNAPQ